MRPVSVPILPSMGRDRFDGGAPSVRREPEGIMGLVTNLCTELSISPEVLARIVGLPAADVAGWAEGGVPPQHHVDFRPLEEFLETVRERAPLPLRGAVRLGLRELDGRSILEGLEREGPTLVRKRLDGLSRLDPIWAREAPAAPLRLRSGRISRSAA